MNGSAKKKVSQPSKKLPALSAPVRGKSIEQDSYKLERRTAVHVTAQPHERAYRAIARTQLQPELNAALAINDWKLDTQDINDLTAELAAQVEAVNKGDMGRAEALLVSQAHTLDEVFAVLIRKALVTEKSAHWEVYLRGAMKAQNQCRMTLGTLGELKSPRAPVAFVKQANIAHGPQQINNGGIASENVGIDRAEEIAERSKLLEANDGERLDFGAAATTSYTDQDLVAMGAIDRTAIRQR